MSNTLTFTVNDAELTIDVDPQATLLSVLRERLGLTGAKLSCGEGAWGDPVPCWSAVWYV